MRFACKNCLKSASAPGGGVLAATVRGLAACLSVAALATAQAQPAQPASSTPRPLIETTSDLATIGQRVRYEWYERWMHQPLRMAPGTRMPQAFVDGKSTLSTVLNGDPKGQAETMWAYLSLGPRLAAAFEHVHMLVFHPRDAAPASLQALLDGGWSTTDIVTLSQIVAFLSFQIRVVTGLRTLAGRPRREVPT